MSNPKKIQRTRIVIYLSITTHHNHLHHCQGPWAAVKQLWRARVTKWDSVLGAGLMREELCARLGVRTLLSLMPFLSRFFHLHTHHDFFVRFYRILPIPFI
jgi:hypothetical protein